MFQITFPQSISEEVCESGMIDAALDLWRQELSPIGLSYQVDVSWFQVR